MSMITVENLTFSYPSGSETIFDHASFQIDTRWKLGLIGRNGRGKTTLFRLLQNEYEFSGSIASPVEFDYFPYPVTHPERTTEEVLLDLCSDAEWWKLIREFHALEVSEEVLGRPFQTLSNGEQTKVLLAALFIREGHFLLIDEPTNHLDASTRALVSSWLNTKSGYILVSHDRAFLDGCVDHILSLNRKTIEVQKGNFSSWFENFQRQQQNENTQNERLKKEIRHLKKAKHQTENWSNQTEKSKNGTRNSGSKIDKGYVGHKAAKMMKRSKSMENRQNKAIEQKSGLLQNAEKAESLKLHPLEFRSDRLVSLSNVQVIYDGRPANAPVSFDLHRHERMVLEGRNGSGKSSLLKALMGNPTEITGNITIGSGLVISYVPQDASFLKGSLSGFIRENDLDESLFKAILRKMDFERALFDQKMEGYSSGQKKKVLLVRSLCQSAHLYIWDEPLNYMDIYSRMQIEQLIEEFDPTMILVEHDRTFTDHICTHSVSVEKAEERR